MLRRDADCIRDEIDRQGADAIAVPDAIQRLMCHGRLDIAPFALRHGIDFATYFPEELQRLLTCTDACIRVSPKGRFLLRIIAMCFDAYLTSNALGQVCYSRAVWRYFALALES